MRKSGYQTSKTEFGSSRSITKTSLFKYTENFTSKNWKISDKKIWYFHISALNIDCGYSLEPPRRGGSNEYPQSMFLSRNKKNNVCPCKPLYKSGVWGGQHYIGMFSWCSVCVPIWRRAKKRNEYTIKGGDSYETCIFPFWKWVCSKKKELASIGNMFFCLFFFSFKE